MYRIAICDDEKIFNESAQVLLENIALKNGIDISVESYLNADILLNDLENGKSHSINLKSILYVEIYGKTLTFHLKDNKILELTKTLSEIRKLLPKDDFIQCHRSFLVALNEIESITRYQILLSGGMKIPVSKLRYTDVQKALIESAAEKNI